MALTANDQNLAIFLLTIIFFPLQLKKIYIMVNALRETIS